MHLLAQRVRNGYSLLSLLSGIVVIIVALVTLMVTQPWKTRAQEKAQLTEIEFLKLENKAYKQQLAYSAFQTAQKDFQDDLVSACKSHGFIECQIDMQNKALVKVK